MNKYHFKGLSTILLLLVLSFNQIKAQPFVDNFGGPLLTSNNAWVSWQSNIMFGMLPITPSAGPAFGNQWFWTNGGTFTPIVPPSPLPFSAGGMIKFNTRNGGLAPAGAIDTGCAYIATPPLDYSARAGAPANVSFYMFHEAYAGATADSVVVYASNNDQLVGAVRLGMVWADPAGFGVGWVQSTLAIPNLAQFNGCTNVVLMFVAYTWTSYRNIYLDNIFIDRFTAPQSVTAATLTNQNTSNVSLGSTNNQIVAVNVNVCGSTTPIQLDSILFNPIGTNIPVDVANAKLFYTGNSPIFSTATQVFTTVNPPLINVPLLGAMGFGNCAAPITLTTGDNYFWLTYDISALGIINDIVDADLRNIVLHGTCLPGGSIAYGTPQTLPGGRPIGVSYCVAPYTVGTCFINYTINDFVSSVYVSSIAGNSLFNLRHDLVTYTTPCGTCNGAPGQNCDRHSPHPPDYTLFAPATLATDKDRTLNLRLSQGKRTATTPDSICVAAGTWFSANNIKVWIDFNGDGDFDDTYPGAGGNITEFIGFASLSDDQAIGVLGSVLGAFPPAKNGDDWDAFQIDMPLENELPSAVFPSGGPSVKTGTVRMRVREVFASNTFTPCNSATFGETEDYDISLVTDCPIPGSKLCKWLGGNVANPTDWFTLSNWCPAIPTQLDTALIAPNGSGYYPIIKSNQLPECATLRIFSPATVTIDAPDVLSGTVLAPNTGKFKAYHNLEIGEAPNTAAQMKVVSNYSNTVISGVASAVGNAAISPFRNDRQDHKIQFIYDPAELGVMGLKSGDLLSNMTFFIRSAAALGAGNLGNFTVKMWQLDNPYVYPAAIPLNTEIAVNDIAPVVLPAIGGITSTTCFGPAILAIPAIPANTTVPITINFTTRCLINTTKYLCIEISRDNPFVVGGVAYPVLYESSLLRTCLTLINANNSISANSNALNITGAGTAAGAAGLNINNGVLNNGTFVNGGIAGPFAYIIGASYVFRPTSTIGVVRQYSKYPIEVGGDWINNSASGLPLGFDAGWSTVKMVNNYVFGVHPNNDLDSIKGSEITTFNELEINDPNSIRMLVNGISIGNQGLIVDSSLIMTAGQLELNQHKVTINNPLAWGIQRTGGSILSENTNNYNKVEWKINTTTGAHLIPFGATVAPADYVPYTFNLLAGDAGNVTVSTYRTNAANLPVPTLPVAVNNLFNFACVDNSANTIDRFWQIDRSTAGAITVNSTFGYTASENTTGKPFTSIVAQRYDGAAAKACGMPTGRWSNPTGVAQSAVSQSQSNVGYLSVTANGVTQFSPWTLSIIETPLPLQLLDFDAKLIDEKVKVYWTVTNEQNIKDYEVYKSYDKENFTFMDMKKAVGPLSGGLTDYFVWDNEPLKGIQYYRLKTTDNTGQISYSKIAVVKIKNSNFGITSLSASDANNVVDLQFMNDSQLPCRISVIDMYGRTIYSKDLGVVKIGVNTLQIPSTFVKGVYTISIENNENRDTRAFVK